MQGGGTPLPATVVPSLAMTWGVLAHSTLVSPVNFAFILLEGHGIRYFLTALHLVTSQPTFAHM